MLSWEKEPSLRFGNRLLTVSHTRTQTGVEDADGGTRDFAEEDRRVDVEAMQFVSY